MKKRIFVFGGSKGIGSAFIKRALERGDSDIVLFARSNPYNFACEFHSVDFLQKESMKLIEEVARQDKRGVSGVVFFQKYRNGAEHLSQWDAISAVEVEFIRDVLETFFVQNSIQSSDGANIVLTSSVLGSFIARNQPLAYFATKAALEQMVRYYAVNLGKKNIKVNAVAPSITLKPENIEFYTKQKELSDFLASLSPLNKMGRAEDVSLAVEFLLQTDYITGQTLRIDGGISVQEIEGLCRGEVEKFLGRSLQH